MRIAVIGAGIGGLAAAVGLTRAGAEVEVLEQRPTPPETGSGLSLFGNGWAALEAIGAGTAVREIAAPRAPRARSGQRTPDGSWLTQHSSQVVSRLRVLYRPELHGVLAGQLPPDAVKYGATARVLSHLGDIRVETTDGATEERYDLVVAADGIRSGVRSTWPNDPGTRYAGYSAWRGVTAHRVDPVATMGETWGHGQRFGYAPLRDGRVYWYAVANMPANHVVADELDDVRRRFADWHNPINELLTATPEEAVTRLAIEDLARPLPTFKRGRCVLVGDAAHAMTPDLGQGANQALEDAAELTHQLTSLAAAKDPDPTDLDWALGTFDRIRRARTQPVAAQARRVGRIAQAEGRIAVWARNAALRAAPATLIERQLEAFGTWTPGELDDARPDAT